MNKDNSMLYIVGAVGLVAIAIMLFSVSQNKFVSNGAENVGMVIDAVSTSSSGYSTTGYGVTSNSTIQVIPRVAYWYGKVNQHIDSTTGNWATDPDGSSGANIDVLIYCKKWYPQTTTVKLYALETISGWMQAT